MSNVEARRNDEFPNDQRKVSQFVLRHLVIPSSFVIRHSSFVLYSALKAIIGSTRVALRAGTQAAMNATAETRRTIPANVPGSDAPTPKRRLLSIRVAANAPATPSSRLMPTSVIA